MAGYDEDAMNALPTWQLLRVVVVPTFAVLLWILLSQRGMDRLDRRIEKLEDELKDFRKQMHDEYIGLLGRIGDHGQRIVRLEQRPSR